jgi:diguanylate cyclase (GGDEF)-like protein
MFERSLRVLVVEDNPGDVLLVQEMLHSISEDRIALFSANRVSRVGTLLSEMAVDAILLDLGLPDSNGLETLRAIHDVCGETPIVVLSSQDDEQLAVTALQVGAQDFLVKGTFNGHILTRAIFYAIKRKEMDSKLFYMAYHDSLTGLSNRKHFHEHLQHSIEWCERGGQKFAVIFLDLDNFKKINDTFGHLAGDLLLQQVSERIRNVVRKVDVVARMGGDEFAIILNNLKTFSYVSHVARKIRKHICRPYKIESELLEMDFSMGISLYPLDGLNESELIRKADRAMYQAKESGAKRFRFYNHEMDEGESARQVVRADFQNAIKNHELCIHFQPIISLRTHAINSLEALVRWNHPQKGLLSPGEFLNDIMGTELIVSLGETVFELVFSCLSKWKAQGILIPVSVNVDLLQIKQPDFHQKFVRLLHRYPDISPHLLEIEILETTSAEDFPNLREVLDGLHELGIRLSIDDFGTGYSSLSYLKHIPFDTLKIDQSFVIGMLENRENLAIIESISSLAKIFGRNVVAEGMEQMSYSPMLMAMGCDLAQGYAISRPLPPERFLEWRQDWINKDHSEGVSPSLPLSELSILLTQISHLSWIQRIISLAEKADQSPLTPFEKEEFGASPVEDWYNHEGISLYGEIPTFQSLSAVHRESLDLVREVFRRIIEKNKSATQYYSRHLLFQKDSLLSLYGALQKDVLFRSMMGENPGKI